MKKIYLIAVVIAPVIILSFSKPCSVPSLLEQKKTIVTYQTHISPLVMANCSPCHFPGKGGNKKPLDTYRAVSSRIDKILRRIQLDLTDRKFMPLSQPKLSDTAIEMFKQWQTDGLLEK